MSDKNPADEQKTYPFPYVVPEIKDWAINTLSVEKEQFMQHVFEFAQSRIVANKREGSLREQLAKILYSERIRLIESPWKVDPPDEMDFWSDIKETLIRQANNPNTAQSDAIYTEQLNRIIWRYLREMMSNFQPTTYRVARRVLPVAFDLILNAANGSLMYRLLGGKRNLAQKLQIVGHIQTIRKLATQGTIVLVPTHFSNLDSLLIGWAADRIGLPAFSYGAGLNLYNTAILGYLFNRLGAYALDRRKKNHVYLEILKSFSQLSIERGVHTLFFPGGTRSRSGQLETKLKMGLLGTMIDAQCSHYEKGENKKIFVVPLVLNYHFVLEAKGLIDQFLEQTGKELYMVEKKAFGGAWNLLKFVWKFLSSSSEMVVNFGRPMDVLGNFVDDNGNSYDAQGRPVDVKDYFVSDGLLKFDYQRNEEYTRRFARILVKRYYTENIVLSSQLIAYIAFEMFRKQYPSLDFYSIFRLPAADAVIFKVNFYKNVEIIREQLVVKADNDEVKLSDIVRHGSIEQLVKHGLDNVGTFHVKKALKKDKNGDISTEDMNLLYYYHNRLEGYNLAMYLQVEAIK
jgi:glycerol-3-phosphate O-acyltransferase